MKVDKTEAIAGMSLILFALGTMMWVFSIFTSSFQNNTIIINWTLFILGYVIAFSSIVVYVIMTSKECTFF